MTATKVGLGETKALFFVNDLRNQVMGGDLNRKLNSDMTFGFGVQLYRKREQNGTKWRGNDGVNYSSE